MSGAAPGAISLEGLLSAHMTERGSRGMGINSSFFQL